jgi:hypothetical protein
VKTTTALLFCAVHAIACGSTSDQIAEKQEALQSYYYDPTGDVPGTTPGDFTPWDCSSGQCAVSSAPYYPLVRDYGLGVQGTQTLFRSGSSFSGANLYFAMANGPASPPFGNPPPVNGPGICNQQTWSPWSLRACVFVTTGASASDIAVGFYPGGLNSAVQLLALTGVAPNFSGPVCGSEVSMAFGQRWTRAHVGCGASTQPKVLLYTTIGSIDVDSMRIAMTSL